MAASLRVYKRRIKSVTATKKITRAMEMIAASRIVKAQRKVAASTPYAVNVQLKTEIRVKGTKNKIPADLERVVKILRDSGYAGYVVLEFEEAGDPYEHVPPIVEKLQQWCA